ncbi:MAG: T9SS type A sorting domain-containing protein [Sphingobacteriales bacterium]|nr:MAG: T9SS type A sorting domain-containing protein [Sphingobacteriales bacterium]
MKNRSLNVFRFLLMLLTVVISKSVNAQYCMPGGDCSTYGDYIQDFSTTGATTNITNASSGCSSGGYNYFSTISASAEQGSTINFSITMGPFPADEYFQIWIDWNQDLDFDDAGEEMFLSAPTTMPYELVTGSLTVPLTAPLGTTRFRLMCSYYSPGTHCAFSSIYGETEDYDITVLPFQCNEPTALATNTVGMNNANFIWNAMANSIGYEYVVDQLASNPTTTGTLTTLNSLSISGLNSSTNYFIHVRSKCAATVFSNWSTLSFTTLFNPCDHPLNATFTALSGSSGLFNWNAVAGTTGYFYEIKTTAVNPASSGIPLPDTSITITGLMAGTQYYFFVRNACSTSSFSDWVSIPFIIEPCYLPPSMLVSNATDTSVDFAWSSVPAANYYEYQVDRNYANPTAGSGFSFITTTNTTASGLVELTKYYIHVRARCYTNDSSAWARDSATTRRGCAKPIVTVTGGNTDSPSVKWNRVGNAIGYEYLLSNNINPPASGTKTPNVSLPAFALPADGKNYYFHVRTECSNIGYSKWATEPLRTGGVEVASFNYEPMLQLYPNPAQNNMVMKIGSQNQSDAVISIADVTGKILNTIIVDSDEMNLDVSTLPTGVYMLKYHTDSYQRVMKFVVER